MSLDIVCSVPHSGTRSLVDLTGFGPNSPRGDWLHFDYDDELLEQHKHAHLHVPIRNPMDVAGSWARRGKAADPMLRAYESMMAALSTFRHTLYRMEDRPALRGVSEPVGAGAHPPHPAKHHQQLVLDEIVNKYKVFFFRYYPELADWRIG